MEKSLEWSNVTESLLSLTKELKLLQVITDNGYSLEDSMQAHEINDQKIDPKYNLTPEHTISKSLQNGFVREVEKLSIKQIRVIYKNILKLQSQILAGLPLSQTIYTFVYLYDKSICKSNLFIYALVESINILGSHIYELVREANSLKEDDNGMSIVSYSNDRISNDEVIEAFVKIEKSLQADLKNKNNDEYEINQLLGYIRLRRILHLFIKALGKSYDNKNCNKIINQISSIRKRILALQQVIPKQDINETVEGVFSTTMNKTLRAHFGFRQIPYSTIQQSIDTIKNALDQFQIILPLATKVTQWKDRLQRIERMPLNLWSKSFIKFNIFRKQSHIFSTIQVQDALVADIDDWVGLKQNTINDDKFKKFTQQAISIINESFYRLLANKMRWQWQASKIYEDLNFVIYLATAYDVQALNKKQLYVCSWFYYYSLSLMIKQILVGFEIKLYEEQQYSYVINRLEGILTVYQKNSQFFLKKFDKGYISSFNEGTLIHKKKKKIDQNVRKMFTDIQFKRGLYYYFKSLRLIMVILKVRGYFTDSFENNLQLRFNNRFRVFKNIQFVKKMDFQQYLKNNKQLQANQKGCLDEAFEMLKQAKLLFQNITNLQSTDALVNQISDSSNLIKLCVQNSLAVMSLRMKQPKKYKIILANSAYPQIQII